MSNRDEEARSRNEDDRKRDKDCEGNEHRLIATDDRVDTNRKDIKSPDEQRLFYEAYEDNNFEGKDLEMFSTSAPMARMRT